MHARRIFEPAQQLQASLIRPRGEDRWESPISIQVHGDLFGILLPLASPEYRNSLEVYDWKRSQFRGVSTQNSLLLVR